MFYTNNLHYLLTRLLFSRLAPLSNMYGLLTCMCSIIFWYVLYTTAYHLGQYDPSSPSTKELYGLSLGSILWFISIYYVKCFMLLSLTNWKGVMCWTVRWCSRVSWRSRCETRSRGSESSAPPGPQSANHSRKLCDQKLML